MDKFKVSDIANLLKISQVTVYKKIKRLNKELSAHSMKEKGSLFFDAEGLEIIRKAISTAPIETTMEVVKTSQMPTMDLTPVISRFGDMEKGILALTEAFKSEVKSLHESMAGLVEENRALRVEVSSLHKAIEYRKVEAEKPINPEILKPSVPIRAMVLEPSQRNITFFESVKLSIDDCFGLMFGRG